MNAKQAEPIQLQSKNIGKKVTLLLLVIILIVAAAGAVYWWRQQNIDELSRDKAALQQQIDDLETSLKEASNNENENSDQTFVVPELGIEFTSSPQLVGLTYVTVNGRVEFSTAEIMGALKAVPDNQGQPWLPGHLVDVMLIRKDDFEKNIKSDTVLLGYTRDQIIKELGDSYLIEVHPQNGPHSSPGFEEYDRLFKERRPILLEALKTARLLDS